MPRQLKVYGWIDFSRRFGTRHRQVRRCVAAYSKAEVARIMDVKGPHALFNLGQTYNELDVAVCIANPGVVFEKSLDDYSKNPPVIMVK